MIAQAFQLPRQDLALAYCRYVEPQNHTSYQDFVAARNDIALDIAYVKETNTRALVKKNKSSYINVVLVFLNYFRKIFTCIVIVLLSFLKLVYQFSDRCR